MIISHLKALIAKKEQMEKRAITYRTLSAETGLSTTTITKLATGSFANIGKSTLDRLCNYFGCQVNQILEYVPDHQVKQHTIEGDNPT